MTGFDLTSISAGFHGNMVTITTEISWNENKDILWEKVEMVVFYSLCLEISVIIFCPWPWVKVTQTDMVEI